MRVKSKWSKRDKTHSVEEVAGALAFIAWRIAGNAVLNMENHEFGTETQSQRLDIMGEFLAFTIHIIDRMTIDRFEPEDRQRFMIELALKSAKHMEDNRRDVEGPGDYRQAFIDTLNQRMDEYSDCAYDAKEGASFVMRRLFGDHVTALMGEKHQKWVTAQIIDIEVPDLFRTLNKSLPNLFM